MVTTDLTYEFKYSDKEFISKTGKYILSERFHVKELDADKAKNYIGDPFTFKSLGNKKKAMKFPGIVIDLINETSFMPLLKSPRLFNFRSRMTSDELRAKEFIKIVEAFDKFIDYRCYVTPFKTVNHKERIVLVKPFIAELLKALRDNPEAIIQIEEKIIDEDNPDDFGLDDIMRVVDVGDIGGSPF